MTDLMDRPTTQIEAATEVEASAPAPTLNAQQGIINARKLTDEDRARLVAQSLDVAHVGRFAHSQGILASTLSSWRSRARAGELSVSEEVRSRLRAEMTQRAFAPRRSSTRSRRLSPGLAAAAVLASLDHKKPALSTAAFFGISVGQLSQLRARARDGLIEIPASERKLLDGQMRRKVSRKASAGETSSKPARPAKPRQPAVKPLLSKIMEARPEPVHAIVVSNDKNRIEIPSHLESHALRGAIDAALAALADA